MLLRLPKLWLRFGAYTIRLMICDSFTSVITYHDTTHVNQDCVPTFNYM